MRSKRWVCMMLLAALLLALPTGALAKGSKVSIKLPAKLGLMQVESSAKLKPTLKGVKASAISFQSSDTGVATISGSGKIQALSQGRTVITVSGGGAKARCGVVVLPKRVSVEAGKQVKLPHGGPEKYQSKNKKIATVNSKGVITGKAAGSTSVKVKYGRQTVTVKVEVTGGAAQPQASESKAAKLDAASQTDQIVLVEYTGGSSATLSVHEKQNGVWVQLWDTKAYVGKNGIGKTIEGDKKTPTGTYNLTTPFGIKDDPGAKLPYLKVTKYHYWCGDSSSEYYNKLVDSRETGREYTSSDEHLIDYKGVYNYCMFIDYNASGEAHKGSCIFLHCTGSNKYTAGCVAIPESNMKKIVKWANSGAKIVIKEAEA